MDKLSDKQKIVIGLLGGLALVVGGVLLYKKGEINSKKKLVASQIREIDEFEGSDDEKIKMIDDFFDEQS